MIWVLFRFSRDLISTRRAILYRYYGEQVLLHAPGTARPRDLAEARARFVGIAGGNLPGGAELDALESRLVLVQRLMAGWTVGWATLFPALGLITQFAVMFRGKSPGDPREIALFVAVSLIPWLVIFPFLSLAGLATQSRYLGHFHRFVGRVTGKSDGGRQAPE